VHKLRLHTACAPILSRLPDGLNTQLIDLVAARRRDRNPSREACRACGRACCLVCVSHPPEAC
jgi:hypothetical protein